MAETSGPRGPCTAPRRRCCPAWLWTATAWALLRPDACPLLACPARCRPGSTWLASISTRTRVSALRRGCPRLPPPPHPGILGREAREKLFGLFLGVLGTRHVSFPGRVHGGAGRLSSQGRETPGPGTEAIPEAPAERVRGSAAFPREPCPPEAYASAETGASGGDSDSRAPAAPGQPGVFKTWARKEQARSTPFETSVPRARILFLANALARRPWAVLAPPLAACGVSVPPRRRRLRGERRPRPRAGGDRLATSRPPGGERRPRDSHPGRRAATAAPGAPCSPAGRRARGAVGRRDWAAAIPKLGEGSGVRADLAGHERRRENLGPDIEPREKVAERAPEASAVSREGPLRLGGDGPRAGEARPGPAAAAAVQPGGKGGEGHLQTCRRPPKDTRSLLPGCLQLLCLASYASLEKRPPLPLRSVVWDSCDFSGSRHSPLGLGRDSSGRSGRLGPVPPTLPARPRPRWLVLPVSLIFFTELFRNRSPGAQRDKGPL